MVSKIKKIHIEENLKSNNYNQNYINKHQDQIKELDIHIPDYSTPDSGTTFTSATGATGSSTSSAINSAATSTNGNDANAVSNNEVKDATLDEKTKKAFDYFFYAHNMLKIYEANRTI